VRKTKKPDTRILQILLSPRIGGAETLVDSLVDEWKLKGISSVVGYLDKDSSQTNKIARLFRVIKLVIRHKPTVIIAHTYLPALYTRFAVGLVIPVHYVLHSGADDHKSKFSQFIEKGLRFSTKSIISVSPRQEFEYVNHFGNRISSTVILNGFSRKFEAKKKYNSKPIRVVTISRVAEVKNPVLWSEIAKLAMDRELPLKFEWWGPLELDCSGIKEFPIELTSNASYLGATSKPWELLEDSDIFLHTSNYEAFGIALVEAAASGTPLVYSQGVASPELEVLNGDYVFRTNDASSALDAIERLCLDWLAVPSRWNGIARKAEDLYSMEKVANKYLNWLFGLK
jgi:glycosyltransferase involved in cell wall biosynthesis